MNRISRFVDSFNRGELLVLLAMFVFVCNNNININLAIAERCADRNQRNNHSHSVHNERNDDDEKKTLKRFVLFFRLRLFVVVDAISLNIYLCI